MNCKQGDLARIISTSDTRYLEVADKIVRVVQLVSTPKKGMPAWLFETPIPVPWGSLLGTADELLRPIGNPGDDVKDESLSWVPVPVKEVAHG